LRQARRSGTVTGLAGASAVLDRTVTGLARSALAGAVIALARVGGVGVRLGLVCAWTGRCRTRADRRALGHGAAEARALAGQCRLLVLGSRLSVYGQGALLASVRRRVRSFLSTGAAFSC
jgi:hypothetical protein